MRVIKQWADQMIAGAVLLLGGLAAMAATPREGMAARGAARVPACQGCSVGAGGVHSCFEADSTDPGNTDCKITYDPNTGRPRCQFNGTSCGGTSALLPADGVAYFAAHGAFVLSPTSLSSGVRVERLCGSVLVADQESGAVRFRLDV